MAATVSQIIQTPHLRTTLHAGGRGIGQAINWAHSCEMPEPWQWLEHGDLLMTIGHGIPPEPAAQAHYVEQLAQVGVSAVAVSRDAAAPPLSREMSAAADRLGLPLLMTAYEVPFATLARAVIDANHYDERRRVARTERLYDSVRRAALGSGQAAPLLAGVSAELGCELLVLDLATWTDVFAPGVAAPAATRAALEAALRQARGQLPGILRLEIDGSVAAVVPVPSGRRTAMLAREGSEGLPALSLLQHAATIVALEVERLRAERAAVHRQGAELLASLLQGPVEVAAAVAQLRDWRFPDGAVAVAVCDGTDRAIDEEALHDELCAAAVPHLLLRQEQSVVAVLPDEEALLDALVQALGDGVPVGLRDGVGGLGHVADAVREARWALAHRGDVRVARYGEHAGLFLPRTVTDARAAVDEVLGPLLEYDRVRRSDLVHSLAVLLRHNRSSQRAAQELSIHRQTLVFRMRRVEELTGRRLRETGDVSELWQALRALEVLEGRSLVAASTAG